METILLEARNILKKYGETTVLNKVQLKVKAGEVHALMGENGAGKSTFMKILIGLEQADEGELFWKGQPLQSRNVHDTLKSGLAMVHQELLQFPELTVAENIFIGNEPEIFPGWINRKKLKHQAESVMQQLGLLIDVNRRMKTLSVAEMQMVEIAKAISHNASLIIMDEPTSAISDKEADALFNLIKKLQASGVGIIYISHKMDEILRISDTVTVLRDGEYMGTYDAKSLDQHTLITLIVGRKLDDIFDVREGAPQESTVLELKHLTGKGFKDISFTLKKGEILGLAGLMGAGRTEIAEAIAGLRPVEAGELMVHNKAVVVNSPADAMNCGIGLVPEDRKRTGLVLNNTVAFNVTLAALSRLHKKFIQNPGAEVPLVKATIKKMQVKTHGVTQIAGYLSGGNQQKLVLAKVMLNNPDIIILDEPTRGIDIGAKADIYKMMRDWVKEGKSIIMISSELPEVLGMSDRVVVLQNGKLKAVIPASDATQETIMQYAMA